jgi:hypothetical protein
VIRNRLAVAAVAVLGAIVLADALRPRAELEPGPDPSTGLLIDLASSREGTWHPVAMLRAAFPGREPETLAVSKVAVAYDELVAIGVSHVPGDRPASAAVELWDADELVHAFLVPAGSFSRGLWFADEGEAIATIGWNGRGYLYDRSGAPIDGTAYFAYETG